MLMLDIAAGGGYTTQLLALVVGSNGTVWTPAPVTRYRAEWSDGAAHQQFSAQLASTD
jgi:predicted methyltransferase